ncbi:MULTISPECIES: hypothetical protein [unclassified Streptomyces]|uniref:hypothetical protein n=1 Tax=unclassified Streptomyces TaxID=2593676 RepID=UPI0033D3319F
MLLRLTYLAVSSVFALMRLLPMSEVDREIEILTLRHQLAVLQRQIDRPRTTAADRAFLATLLHRLPQAQAQAAATAPDRLTGHNPAVTPRPHAPQPHNASRHKAGRPPTRRAIQALVLSPP